MAEHKERLARAMTREMGKVIAEARGDVQEGIDIAFLMAGEGRRMFGDTVPSELPDKWAMSIRQPIGVAGIITPVELPDRDPVLEDDARPGRRQHRRVQAVVGDAAVRDPARRAHGRGGLPGRHRQPRHRVGGRGGRRDRRQPRRAGDLVHGLVRHRARHRGAGGPPAEAGQPRARRQERRRRPARRRPRPRRRRDPVVGVRDHGPAVHGVLAGDRGRARRGRAVPPPRGAGGRAPPG